MHSRDFEGTTALVTGSTSGIGRETAIKLAARGAYVMVTGRDASRGTKVVEAIRANGGKAEFVQADLRDVDSARDLSRRATEVAGGHIGILVNNAGVAPVGPTDQTSDAVFDAAFDLNVKVPFFLAAELAPAMAERGKGAIVNVITMAAQIGMPGLAVYSASKAALSHLTKAWAAEFGPRGVRVNAVSPGPTRTPMTEPFGPMLDQWAAPAPAGRVAQPGEIAAAIVYLASDEASFVHGVVLPVDGGRVAV